MTTPPPVYRTEFAIEGVWYTNALRFTDPDVAVAEAMDRFSRWIVPTAWRVVNDDVPQKQPHVKDEPTAFHVSDANGVVLA